MIIENKLKNIPHIYYVNLYERVDRKKYMETQFKNWGLDNFTRISASKFLVSEKENLKHHFYELENIKYLKLKELYYLTFDLVFQLIILL